MASDGITVSRNVVNIIGDIGESFFGESVTAKDFKVELDKLDKSIPLDIYINSHGGSVDDGLAIYNAIRSFNDTTTYNMGIAASIASLIFVSGNKRVMQDGARLMIHAPWAFSMGNAEELRNMADVLDGIAITLAGVYAKAVNGSVDFFSSMLKDTKNYYFTGEEALALGLATNVNEEKVSDTALSLVKDTKIYASAQPLAETYRESVNSRIESIKQYTTLAKVFAGVKSLEPLFKRYADSGYDVKGLKEAIVNQHYEAKPVTTFTAGVDASEKMRNAFVKNILVLAQAKDDDGKIVTHDNANPYRGAGLLDMARVCLDKAGVSYSKYDKASIAHAALTQSVSDFPVIMSEAANRLVVQAYKLQPDTWSKLCLPSSMNDFRPHYFYKKGSIGNLESLLPNGQMRQDDIKDGQRENFKLSTVAKVIALTRQMLINDDIGHFADKANDLGMAAKRTIETAFYTLLTSNAGLGPTMSDGLTLFHANHGNVGTAAVPSINSLIAARIAMKQQMDINSKDFIDAMPEIALVTLSNEDTVKMLNTSQFDPEATNNNANRPNMVRGMFSSIIGSPRLTGTRWYIFAGVNNIPTFRIGFLNGNTMPTVQSEAPFGYDGLQWSIIHDFGIGATEHRGAFTNAGV